MSKKVIIVGGGIVGTAAAYYSAKEGLDVTLLERNECGYGASGRNPGFVWLHCRNPGFALEVSRAGRELYTELLDELPGGFEFRAKGGLIYFTTPEQGRVFEEFVAARQADGLQMELIDGAAVRELVPVIREDVLGASFSPEDAQINTPTVVQALAAGARREGADIREHVEVRSFLGTEDGVTGVSTSDGDLYADTVVLATGAWSSEMLKPLGIDLAIGAERLQVVGSEPLPLQIEPVVYGALAAKQYTLFRNLPSWNEADFVAPYEREYELEMLSLVAQRANGQILMGCPMDYPEELDFRPTVAGLGATARYIASDFPGLAGAPVERVWAGCLPYTSDMAPVIDEARPGLLIASGHVFGNAAGPMSGKLIAQLLDDREPDLDLSECRFERALERIQTGVPARW